VTFHRKFFLYAALFIVACQAIATELATAKPFQTLVLTVEEHNVVVDVYSPLASPTGAAILVHGFTRSRKTMAHHAQALADQGLLAITPDMPCTFDFRCNARAIAGLVDKLRNTEAFGESVKRVMLVGFSAGGLSSLMAADTPGVVGFVGLDPFDRLGPQESELLGLAAAKRLKVESLLLRAPASQCNAQSVAAVWRTELQELWRDTLIAGASHCDFEAPTDWMCRLACGATDVSRQLQVRKGLLDAAARWMQ
jgi:dienelactone hydrolase